MIFFKFCVIQAIELIFIKDKFKKFDLSSVFVKNNLP